MMRAKERAQAVAGDEAGLVLRGVSRRYGRKLALADIDIRFPPGLTLIRGGSGAGKSTLLRLCATEERPSRGALSWNGRAVWPRPRFLRRALGYAPQAVDLPEASTGRQFLSFMAALKGLGGDRRAEADALLQELGLGPDADRPIGAYSGGMRRRLLLAQALLGRPGLIVADEPTAELDAASASRAVTHLLQAAADAVVICSTHDPTLWQANAAQRVMVDKGRLSRSAAPMTAGDRSAP